MRVHPLLLLAVLALAGCPSPPGPAGPGPTTGPTTAPGGGRPTAEACDAASLPARVGTEPGMTFAGCAVPTMIALLGTEVRQAKRDCRAFIAFESNWERRTRNWEPLVAEIERASQPPMAVTAHTALGIVKQLPGGRVFREDGLDDLVKLTRTLETQASVTSAAVPDCGS